MTIPRKSVLEGLIAEQKEIRSRVTLDVPYSAALEDAIQAFRRLVRYEEIAERSDLQTTGEDPGACRWCSSPLHTDYGTCMNGMCEAVD